MSHLFWVFVLVAVAVIPSDSRDSRPMDCQEWQARGNYTSGVYTVWLGGNPVRVRCDMDTDGGGWTVIQRRGNFSHQQSFDWYWRDYKYGIGQVERDFWLGNDNIFALTNQGNYSLRMDMTGADGESAYEEFEDFRIEDEDANYKLHVRGGIGTAGNSLTSCDGEMFSTKDRKNNDPSATNCAKERKGGFWYANYCAGLNPNGLYKPGVKNDTSVVYYGDFKEDAGLFSFDMKIRRL